MVRPRKSSACWSKLGPIPMFPEEWEALITAYDELMMAGKTRDAFPAPCRRRPVRPKMLGSTASGWPRRAEAPSWSTP